MPQSSPAFLSWAHPLVQEWFAGRFGSPTEPQEQGWPPILAGKSTLICAPTGSGKTLAAFLACIDHLIRKALGGGLQDRTEVLYVSPLKALSNDIRRNLEIPLSEITALAGQRGLLIPPIRAAVRLAGGARIAARRASPRAHRRNRHPLRRRPVESGRDHYTRRARAGDFRQNDHPERRCNDRGTAIRRWRYGVRQLAAALIRRACSRPHLPIRGTPAHGQQAGLRESGSKLPHSKALRPLSRTIATRKFMEFAPRMRASKPLHRDEKTKAGQLCAIAGDSSW